MIRRAHLVLIGSLVLFSFIGRAFSASTDFLRYSFEAETHGLAYGQQVRRPDEFTIDYHSVDVRFLSNFSAPTAEFRILTPRLYSGEPLALQPGQEDVVSDIPAHIFAEFSSTTGLCTRVWYPDGAAPFGEATVKQLVSLFEHRLPPLTSGGSGQGGIPTLYRSVDTGPQGQAAVHYRAQWAEAEPGSGSNGPPLLRLARASSHRKGTHMRTTVLTNQLLGPCPLPHASNAAAARVLVPREAEAAQMVRFAVDTALQQLVGVPMGPEDATLALDGAAQANGPPVDPEELYGREEALLAQTTADLPAGMERLTRMRGRAALRLVDGPGMNSLLAPELQLAAASDPNAHWMELPRPAHAANHNTINGRPRLGAALRRLGFRDEGLAIRPKARDPARNGLAEGAEPPADEELEAQAAAFAANGAPWAAGLSLEQMMAAATEGDDKLAEGWAHLERSAPPGPALPSSLPRGWDGWPGPLHDGALGLPSPACVAALGGGGAAVRGCRCADLLRLSNQAEGISPLDQNTSYCFADMQKFFAADPRGSRMACRLLELVALGRPRSAVELARFDAALGLLSALGTPTAQRCVAGLLSAEHPANGGLEEPHLRQLVLTMHTLGAGTQRPTRELVAALEALQARALEEDRAAEERARDWEARRRDLLARAPSISAALRALDPQLAAAGANADPTQPTPLSEAYATVIDQAFYDGHRADRRAGDVEGPEAVLTDPDRPLDAPGRANGNPNAANDGVPPPLPPQRRADPVPRAPKHVGGGPAPYWPYKGTAPTVAEVKAMMNTAPEAYEGDESELGSRGRAQRALPLSGLAGLALGSHLHDRMAAVRLRHLARVAIAHQRVEALRAANANEVDAEALAADDFYQWPLPLPAADATNANGSPAPADRQLANEAVPELAGLDEFTRQAYARLAARAREACRPGVDLYQCTGALAALGNAGPLPAEVSGLLLPLAGHRAPEMRTAALFALRRAVAWAPRPVVKALLEAYADGHEYEPVRMSALEALRNAAKDLAAQTAEALDQAVARGELAEGEVALRAHPALGAVDDAVRGLLGRHVANMRRAQRTGGLTRLPSGDLEMATGVLANETSLVSMSLSFLGDLQRTSAMPFHLGRSLRAALLELGGEELAGLGAAHLPADLANHPRVKTAGLAAPRDATRYGFTDRDLADLLALMERPEHYDYDRAARSVMARLEALMAHPIPSPDNEDQEGEADDPQLRADRQRLYAALKERVGRPAAANGLGPDFTGRTLVGIEFTGGFIRDYMKSLGNHKVGAEAGLLLRDQARFMAGLFGVLFDANAENVAQGKLYALIVDITLFEGRGQFAGGFSWKSPFASLESIVGKIFEVLAPLQALLGRTVGTFMDKAVPLVDLVDLWIRRAKTGVEGFFKFAENCDPLDPITKAPLPTLRCLFSAFAWPGHLLPVWLTGPDHLLPVWLTCSPFGVALMGKAFEKYANGTRAKMLPYVGRLNTTVSMIVTGFDKIDKGLQQADRLTAILSDGELFSGWLQQQIKPITDRVFNMSSGLRTVKKVLDVVGMVQDVVAQVDMDGLPAVTDASQLQLDGLIAGYTEDAFQMSRDAIATVRLRAANLSEAPMGNLTAFSTQMSLAAALKVAVLANPLAVCQAQYAPLLLYGNESGAVLLDAIGQVQAFLAGMDALLTQLEPSLDKADAVMAKMDQFAKLMNYVGPVLDIFMSAEGSLDDLDGLMDSLLTQAVGAAGSFLQTALNGVIQNVTKRYVAPFLVNTTLAIVKSLKLNSSSELTTFVGVFSTSIQNCLTNLSSWLISEVTTNFKGVDSIGPIVSSLVSQLGAKVQDTVMRTIVGETLGYVKQRLTAVATAQINKMTATANGAIATVSAEILAVTKNRMLAATFDSTVRVLADPNRLQSFFTKLINDFNGLNSITSLWDDLYSGLIAPVRARFDTLGQEIKTNLTLAAKESLMFVINATLAKADPLLVKLTSAAETRIAVLTKSTELGALGGAALRDVLDTKSLEPFFSKLLDAILGTGPSSFQDVYDALVVEYTQRIEVGVIERVRTNLTAIAKRFLQGQFAKWQTGMTAALDKLLLPAQAFILRQTGSDVLANFFVSSVREFAQPAVITDFLGRLIDRFDFKSSLGAIYRATVDDFTATAKGHLSQASQNFMSNLTATARTFVLSLLEPRLANFSLMIDGALGSARGWINKTTGSTALTQAFEGAVRSVVSVDRVRAFVVGFMDDFMAHPTDIVAIFLTRGKAFLKDTQDSVVTYLKVNMTQLAKDMMRSGVSSLMGKADAKIDQLATLAYRQLLNVTGSETVASAFDGVMRGLLQPSALLPLLDEFVDSFRVDMLLSTSGLAQFPTMLEGLASNFIDLGKGALNNLKVQILRNMTRWARTAASGRVEKLVNISTVALNATLAKSRASIQKLVGEKAKDLTEGLEYAIRATLTPEAIRGFLLGLVDQAAGWIERQLGIAARTNGIFDGLGGLIEGQVQPRLVAFVDEKVPLIKEALLQWVLDFAKNGLNRIGDILGPAASRQLPVLMSRAMGSLRAVGSVGSEMAPAVEGLLVGAIGDPAARVRSVIGALADSLNLEEPILDQMQAALANVWAEIKGQLAQLGDTLAANATQQARTLLYPTIYGIAARATDTLNGLIMRSSEAVRAAVPSEAVVGLYQEALAGLIAPDDLTALFLDALEGLTLGGQSLEEALLGNLAQYGARVKTQLLTNVRTSLTSSLNESLTARAVTLAAALDTSFAQALSAALGPLRLQAAQGQALAGQMVAQAERILGAGLVSGDQVVALVQTACSTFVLPLPGDSGFDLEGALGDVKEAVAGILEDTRLMAAASLDAAMAAIQNAAVGLVRAAFAQAWNVSDAVALLAPAQDLLANATSRAQTALQTWLEGSMELSGVPIPVAFNGAQPWLPSAFAPTAALTADLLAGLRAGLQGALGEDSVRGAMGEIAAVVGPQSLGDLQGALATAFDQATAKARRPPTTLALAGLVSSLEGRLAGQLRATLQYTAAASLATLNQTRDRVAAAAKSRVVALTASVALGNQVADAVRTLFSRETVATLEEDIAACLAPLGAVVQVNETFTWAQGRTALRAATITAAQCIYEEVQWAGLDAASALEDAFATILAERVEWSRGQLAAFVAPFSASAPTRFEGAVGRIQDQIADLLAASDPAANATGPAGRVLAANVTAATVADLGDILNATLLNAGPLAAQLQTALQNMTDLWPATLPTPAGSVAAGLGVVAPTLLEGYFGRLVADFATFESLPALAQSLAGTAIATARMRAIALGGEAVRLRLLAQTEAAIAAYEDTLVDLLEDALGRLSGRLQARGLPEGSVAALEGLLRAQVDTTRAALCLRALAGRLGEVSALYAPLDGPALVARVTPAGANGLITAASELVALVNGSVQAALEGLVTAQLRASFVGPLEALLLGAGGSAALQDARQEAADLGIDVPAAFETALREVLADALGLARAAAGNFSVYVQLFHEADVGGYGALGTLVADLAAVGPLGQQAPAAGYVALWNRTRAENAAEGGADLAAGLPASPTATLGGGGGATLDMASFAGVDELVRAAVGEAAGLTNTSTALDRFWAGLQGLDALLADGSLLGLRAAMGAALREEELGRTVAGLVAVQMPNLTDILGDLLASATGLEADILPALRVGATAFMQLMGLADPDPDRAAAGMDIEGSFDWLLGQLLQRDLVATVSAQVAQKFGFISKIAPAVLQIIQNLIPLGDSPLGAKASGALGQIAEAFQLADSNTVGALMAQANAANGDEPQTGFSVTAFSGKVQVGLSSSLGVTPSSIMGAGQTHIPSLDFMSAVTRLFEGDVVDNLVSSLSGGLEVGKLLDMGRSLVTLLANKLLTSADRPSPSPPGPACTHLSTRVLIGVEPRMDALFVKAHGLVFNATHSDLAADLLDGALRTAVDPSRVTGFFSQLVEGLLHPGSFVETLMASLRDLATDTKDDMIGFLRVNVTGRIKDELSGYVMTAVSNSSGFLQTGLVTLQTKLANITGSPEGAAVLVGALNMTLYDADDLLDALFGFLETVRLDGSILDQASDMLMEKVVPPLLDRAKTLGKELLAVLVDKLRDKVVGGLDSALGLLVTKVTAATNASNSVHVGQLALQTHLPGHSGENALFAVNTTLVLATAREALVRAAGQLVTTEDLLAFLDPVTESLYALDFDGLPGLLLSQAKTLGLTAARRLETILRTNLTEWAKATLLKPHLANLISNATARGRAAVESMSAKLVNMSVPEAYVAKFAEAVRPYLTNDQQLEDMANALLDSFQLPSLGLFMATNADPIDGLLSRLQNIGLTALRDPLAAVRALGAEAKTTLLPLAQTALRNLWSSQRPALQRRVNTFAQNVSRSAALGPFMGPVVGSAMSAALDLSQLDGFVGALVDTLDTPDQLAAAITAQLPALGERLKARALAYATGTLATLLEPRLAPLGALAAANTTAASQAALAEMSGWLVSRTGDATLAASMRAVVEPLLVPARTQALLANLTACYRAALPVAGSSLQPDAWQAILPCMEGRLTAFAAEAQAGTQAAAEAHYALLKTQTQDWLGPQYAQARSAATDLFAQAEAGLRTDVAALVDPAMSGAEVAALVTRVGEAAQAVLSNASSAEAPLPLFVAGLLDDPRVLAQVLPARLESLYARVASASLHTLRTAAAGRALEDLATIEADALAALDDLDGRDAAIAQARADLAAALVALSPDTAVRDEAALAQTVLAPALDGFEALMDDALSADQVRLFFGGLRDDARLAETVLAGARDRSLGLVTPPDALAEAGLPDLEPAQAAAALAGLVGSAYAAVESRFVGPMAADLTRIGQQAAQALGADTVDVARVLRANCTALIASYYLRQAQGQALADQLAANLTAYAVLVNAEVAPFQQMVRIHARADWLQGAGLAGIQGIMAHWAALGDLVPRTLGTAVRYDEYRGLVASLQANVTAATELIAALFGGNLDGFLGSGTAAQSGLLRALIGTDNLVELAVTRLSGAALDLGAYVWPMLREVLGVDELLAQARSVWEAFKAHALSVFPGGTSGTNPVTSVLGQLVSVDTVLAPIRNLTKILGPIQTIVTNMLTSGVQTALAGGGTAGFDLRAMADQMIGTLRQALGIDRWERRFDDLRLLFTDIAAFATPARLQGLIGDAVALADAAGTSPETQRMLTRGLELAAYFATHAREMVDVKYWQKLASDALSKFTGLMDTVSSGGFADLVQSLLQSDIVRMAASKVSGNLTKYLDMGLYFVELWKNLTRADEIDSQSAAYDKTAGGLTSIGAQVQNLLRSLTDPETMKKVTNSLMTNFPVADFMPYVQKLRPSTTIYMPLLLAVVRWLQVLNNMTANSDLVKIGQNFFSNVSKYLNISGDFMAMVDKGVTPAAVKKLFVTWAKTMATSPEVLATVEKYLTQGNHTKLAGMISKYRQSFVKNVGNMTDLVRSPSHPGDLDDGRPVQDACSRNRLPPLPPQNQVNKTATQQVKQVATAVAKAAFKALDEILFRSTDLKSYLNTKLDLVGLVDGLIANQTTLLMGYAEQLTRNLSRVALGPIQNSSIVGVIKQVVGAMDAVLPEVVNITDTASRMMSAVPSDFPAKDSMASFLGKVKEIVGTVVEWRKKMGNVNNKTSDFIDFSLLLVPLNRTIQDLIRNSLGGVLTQPLKDFQNMIVTFVAEDMHLEDLRTWVLEMKNKAIEFVNSGLEKLTSMVTDAVVPPVQAASNAIKDAIATAMSPFKEMLGFLKSILGMAGANEYLEDGTNRIYHLRVAFGRSDIARLRALMATVRAELAPFQKLYAPKVPGYLSSLPAVSLELQHQCGTLTTLLAAGVVTNGTGTSSTGTLAAGASRSPSIGTAFASRLRAATSSLLDLMVPLDEAAAPVRGPNATLLWTMASHFDTQVEGRLLVPLTDGLQNVDVYRRNFTEVMRPALEAFVTGLKSLGPLNTILDVLADPLSALDGIKPLHDFIVDKFRYIHIAVDQIKTVFDKVKEYGHIEQVKQVVAVVNGVIGASDVARKQLPDMVAAFLKGTGLADLLKPIKGYLQTFSGVIKGPVNSFLEIVQMIIGKIRQVFSWLDFGLEKPALAAPATIPQCSADLCMHTLPRSIDLYKDYLFMIKYLHFADLAYGSMDWYGIDGFTSVPRALTLPGLWDGHVPQGVGTMKINNKDEWIVQYYQGGRRLSTPHPSILAFMGPKDGALKKLISLYDPEGRPFANAHGMLVVKDFVYVMNGTGHMCQYNTSIIRTLRMAGGPPSAATAGAMYRLDVSPGGPLAFQDDEKEPMLWAADSHEAGHADVPTHHGTSVRSTLGWMVGYPLGPSGEMTATATYQVHYVGPDVRGISFVKQLGFEYVVLTRCFNRPGRCTMQFHNFTYEATTAQLPGGQSIAGCGVFSKSSNMQSVGVPSGAEGLCPVGTGEDLLVAFSSSASDFFQTVKWSLGDNEDRLQIARVPILRTVKPTVTANVIKLVIAMKEYVNKPAIPYKFDNDDQKQPGARDAPAKEKGNTPKVPMTFFQYEYNFVIVVVPCDIGVTLRGAFKVGLSMGLDLGQLSALPCRVSRLKTALTPFNPLRPDLQEISASVIPTFAFIIEFEGAASLKIFRVGIGIRCTIMETSLIPIASVRFWTRPPTVCLQLDVEFIPLQVEVYVFIEFKLCIGCKFWVFGVRCWINYCGKLSFTILRLRTPTFRYTIFKICFGSGTPVGPGPGKLEASQTALHTVSAKWSFGDEKPKSGGIARLQVHHYMLCVGSTPGSDDLMAWQNMEGETSGTLDGVPLPNWPMGAVAYVTAKGVTMTGGYDTVSIPINASDHEPTWDSYACPRYIPVPDTFNVSLPRDPAVIRLMLMLGTAPDLVRDSLLAHLPAASWGAEPQLLPLRATSSTVLADDIVGSMTFETPNIPTRYAFRDLDLAHGSTSYVTVRAYTNYSVESVMRSPVTVDTTPPRLELAEGPLGLMDDPERDPWWYNTNLRFQGHPAVLEEPESELVPKLTVRVYAEYNGEYLLDLASYYPWRPAEGEWAATPAEVIPQGTMIYSHVTATNIIDLTAEATSPGQMYDSKWPTVDYLYDGLPVGDEQIATDAQAQTETDHYSVHFCVYDKETGISNVSVALSTRQSPLLAPDLVDWVPFNLTADEFGASDYCNVITFTQLAMVPNHKYYALLRVSDRAGHTTTDSSTGLVIDQEPPTPGTVYDGYLRDFNETASSTQYPVTWVDFRDNYFLKTYYVGLGTACGRYDALNMSEAGPVLSTVLQGLDLQHGVRYYATVTAEDLVGNRAAACSDGLLVDLTAPLAPAGGAGAGGDGGGLAVVAEDLDPADLATGGGQGHYTQASTEAVLARWEPCTDPETGIASYELALGTVALGTDAAPFTYQGDAGPDLPDPLAVLVDTTAPALSELAFAATVTTHVRLRWRVAEPEARIASSRVHVSVRCDTFTGHHLAARLNGTADLSPLADWRNTTATTGDDAATAQQPQPLLQASNHTFAADLTLALSAALQPGVRVCDGRYLDYLPTGRFVPVYWARAVDPQAAEQLVELLTDDGAGAWAASWRPRCSSWRTPPGRRPPSAGGLAACLAEGRNWTAVAAGAGAGQLPAGFDRAAQCTAGALAGCPGASASATAYHGCGPAPAVVAAAVVTSTRASDAHFFTGLGLADGYYGAADHHQPAGHADPDRGRLAGAAAAYDPTTAEHVAAELDWVRLPQALMWSGVADPESGLLTVELGLHEAARAELGHFPADRWQHNASDFVPSASRGYRRLGRWATLSFSRVFCVDYSGPAVAMAVVVTATDEANAEGVTLVATIRDPDSGLREVLVGLGTNPGLPTWCPWGPHSHR
ncbi:putative DNA double-strand break repair Rad50 ATPase [Paratrimastix pyriformis]|uniref:DNA double-strand break repair Rad50 ATPase n=1 Tax=Paratrimastix pyriformis TaxID=342808 RepID=A0ABQ8UIM0_9EUKA|nr:putative DNA double-strand break repair Rad50 ATPase [Paratrimastix pyriformis]